MSTKTDTSILGKSVTHDQREFARIDVRIAVTLQPLDEGMANRVRDRIRCGPSVWAPPNETSLREMAHGPGNEAVLAQAVLDLTFQVVSLQHRVAAGGPLRTARLTQLSGGGGQVACDVGFEIGDWFEIRFEDLDEEVPPILGLGRVVHVLDDGETGFAFDALHPRDQEQLMRLIYRIQRQTIRRAHAGDSEDR